MQKSQKTQSRCRQDVPYVVLGHILHAQTSGTCTNCVADLNKLSKNITGGIPPLIFKSCILKLLLHMNCGLGSNAS